MLSQFLTKILHKRRNLKLELDWRAVYHWHESVYYQKGCYLQSVPKMLMLKALDS